MKNTLTAILVIFLLSSSMGIIVWCFVSTHRAFKKFKKLDETVRKKLLFVDYYMYLVRHLTTDELNKTGTLPDAEMVSLNDLHDMEKSLECIMSAVHLPDDKSLP